MVTGPPAAKAAVDSYDGKLPEAWREEGPPSTRQYLEWLCSSVAGRVELLNDLERLLCRHVALAGKWDDADTVPDLGVRVPREHPAVLAREQAWAEWAQGCAAARDWALHAALTGSTVPEELIAWYLWLKDSTAYWDAAGAVDEVLNELRDRRLDMMTPEQRHRYWWGDRTASDRPEWEQAERVAEAALRRIGFSDAARTPAGADKGLDVVGDTVAAQVKYTAVPVGRPVLQQLRGAADGRISAFFSRAGYTSSAIEYAEEVSMALFTIALPTTISPVTSIAREMVDHLHD